MGCLVDQLLLLILGDFSAHNLLWGGITLNSRGHWVEAMFSSSGLCLINTGPTLISTSLPVPPQPLTCPYVHLQFFTGKSYSLNNTFGSDHFPIVLAFLAVFTSPSHPAYWNFGQASWDEFTSTTIFPHYGNIEATIAAVKDCLLHTADLSITKTSTPTDTPSLMEL